MSVVRTKVIHMGILQFERDWTGPRKEDAIRAEFGVGLTRYYQMLDAAIREPDAVRDEPMLVRRLVAGRDARTSAREGRRFSLN